MPLVQPALQHRALQQQLIAAWGLTAGRGLEQLRVRVALGSAAGVDGM